MHHPQPHFFDTNDGDHHRCLDSHRAILTHPYAMPNHRSSTGLPPGHPGQSAPPLGPAYDQVGGRAGPSGSGSGSGGGHGFENQGPGQQQDEAGQRKRIPVACGRCRKRKIRCSGDSGNGEPCSNCRSAGFSPCQFLRVQSHDPNSSGKDQGFGYNIESSRQFQARGPLPPNPYGPGTGFDAFNAATAASSAHAHLGSLPYRNGSGYSHGHGSGPDTPRTSSYLSWSPPTAAYAESGAAEAQAQAQAGRISNGGNDNSSSGGHTSTYGQHNHHHHHPGYYHPAGISQPQEARFLSPFAFSSYTIAGHPSAAVVSLASLASRPSPVLSGPATIAGEHSGSFAYHQIAQAQALQTPAGEGSATSNAQGSTAAVSAASPGPSSESTSSTAAQQQQLLRNDSVSSLASYSRHTASPTASLQGATPSSSSYDNYSPSPISGYAHMTPGHDQSSSRSAELYTTSPRVTSSSESGTGFPSSLGGYVYHDTTAAAAIAAASHRRGTPENVGGRLSNSGSGVASSSGSYSQSPTNVNTSTSPFAMAAEMSEDDERKAPVSMRQ